MSNRKARRRRLSARKGNGRSSPPHPPGGRQGRSIINRSLVWTAGFMAAVLTAAGGAFGSGIGQRFLDWMFTNGNQSSGPPVRIEFVRQEATGSFAYVSSNRLRLSSEELKTLSRLAHNSGYDDWMAARGAIDPEGTVIQIGVSDNEEQPIRVVSMGVASRHCSKPLTGTLFYRVPSSGGGTAQGGPGSPERTVQVALNLNASSPIMQNPQNSTAKSPGSASSAGNSAGGGDLGNGFFNSNTIPLISGDLQVITVYSFSVNLSCTFKLTLTVDYRHKLITESISDDDKLFETAGGLMDPFKYQALYVSQGQFRRENPLTYKFPNLPNGKPMQG